MDKIIILDFGSQTTQLIGRRIRDFGVYSEIYHGDIALTDDILTSDVKGVILSGSPFSVYEEGAPKPVPGSIILIFLFWEYVMAIRELQKITVERSLPLKRRSTADPA
jgi:hypothetical protein